MSSNIKLIDDHLKELIDSIHYDIIDVLYYQSKISEGGYHSIPRNIFSYLDYMGSLCYDERGSTENAVKYIENSMGYVNEEYKEYGRLIYVMWRHGTIHEFGPKILRESENGPLIGWTTNKTFEQHNRRCHLKTYKCYGEDKQYSIVINLFQLTEDLILSINKLISDIKSDSELFNQVQDRYMKIISAKLVDDLQGGDETKKKIKEQILNATENQSGIISENGTVIDE